MDKKGTFYYNTEHEAGQATSIAFQVFDATRSQGRIRLRGGDFSNIWSSSLTTALLLQERWSILHNTSVTKQWTKIWPYIANGVFRIVQNHSEKSYFCRFWGGLPMSNPSTSPWTAWPDGAGRWDNRMAAQHLPRDLVRPSSSFNNSLKRREGDRPPLGSASARPGFEPNQFYWRALYHTARFSPGVGK